MDIVIWLVIGLVAGVLALLALNRTLPREPTGWIGALVVGLIGGLAQPSSADLRVRLDL